MILQMSINMLHQLIRLTKATLANSIWDGGTLRVPFPSDIQRCLSSNVQLKTRRVGEAMRVKSVEAQTSSRWCGV
ncbi:hypothetical protein TNCV_2454641 [Trichonephila clavipes]|nr:hypothetical protein TNCV_2454641 [Trichonephila clavipes]